MGSRAVSHIELSSVPVPVLIVSAAVGGLAVAVVVLRVMPKWQRAQIIRNNLAPGVGLLAVIAFFSRKMLWYEGSAAEYRSGDSRASAVPGHSPPSPLVSCGGSGSRCARRGRRRF